MERWEKSPSVVPARDDLVARLRVRFAEIPAENVRRCVDDLWCCCAHLGVRPEERTIERLAASRLTGVLRGARPPYPDGRTASAPPGSTVPGRRPAGTRPAAPPRPPRRTGRVPAEPADLTASSRPARAAVKTPIGM
ncbi:hypothetical protein [Actinomadura formosensis]|uniref:hypothetical protein n=2 Tax=Actinomadura formosensis TaxID=60706 RepID=UPI000829E85E|nr:hypothetical protein [Actinomadura formosensis]